MRLCRNVSGATSCFWCAGTSKICGESPQGAWLSTNPVATCKFQVVMLAEGGSGLFMFSRGRIVKVEKFFYFCRL